MELDLRIIELESGRVYNYGGRLHWKYVELPRWPRKVAILAWPIKGMRTRAAWFTLRFQTHAHGLIILIRLRFHATKAQAHLPNGSVVDRPQDIIFEVADNISVQRNNLCCMLECLACAY